MRIERFPTTFFPDWKTNIFITTTPDDIKDMSRDMLSQMIMIYSQTLGRPVFELFINKNLMVDSEIWIYLKIWAYYCKQNYKTPLIIMGCKEDTEESNDKNEHPYILEIGMVDTMSGYMEKFYKVENHENAYKAMYRICTFVSTDKRTDLKNNE